MSNLFTKVAACVVVTALVSSPAAFAHAPHVVRVEEDWELVVQTPDPSTVGPQVTCVISPNGNVDGCHATFELNHHTQPSYGKGGLQLQRWHAEHVEDARKVPCNHVMATEGEVVTWTQAMSYQDGVLSFEITNGHSTTWGNFGGEGYLKSAAQETEITTLSQYSPTTSVNNSGVGFAGNRVASLVLKRARLIMSDGTVLEDNTARSAHSGN